MWEGGWREVRWWATGVMGELEDGDGRGFSMSAMEHYLSGRVSSC